MNKPSKRRNQTLTLQKDEWLFSQLLNGHLPQVAKIFLGQRDGCISHHQDAQQQCHKRKLIRVWIKDPGYDPLDLTTRSLMYIGETINEWSRLYDHYYHGEKGRGGRSKSKAKGIGPIFTHVRMIKGFKRLQFDTVRRHEETKLVRKYLPYKNQASQFTDKYKCIMLNSNGEITPWDLMYPYLIHGRDYYKAFLAWDKEDMSLIEKELIEPNNFTMSGEPNMRTVTNHFYKKGKKLPFGQFMKDVVINRHKKQHEAMKLWRRNMLKWTKEYATDFYLDKVMKDRGYNRSNYKQNRARFIKIAKLNKRIRRDKKEQDSERTLAR